MGSERVLVSPSSFNCLDAIFLNILRMIFPLLVLGSPGAQWILSGAAKAPIWPQRKKKKKKNNDLNNVNTNKQKNNLIFESYRVSIQAALSGRCCIISKSTGEGVGFQ